MSDTKTLPYYAYRCFSVADFVKQYGEGSSLVLPVAELFAGGARMIEFNEHDGATVRVDPYVEISALRSSLEIERAARREAERRAEEAEKRERFERGRGDLLEERALRCMGYARTWKACAKKLRRERDWQIEHSLIGLQAYCDSENAMAEKLAEAARWNKGAVEAGQWVAAPEAIPRARESELISIRMPTKMLGVLRAFAQRRGIGYQVLIKQWLDDRIREEAEAFRERAKKFWEMNVAAERRAAEAEQRCERMRETLSEADKEKP